MVIILSLIHISDLEDQVSGIFYSLTSDNDKENFLKDFKSAVEYLSKGEEDYEKVAQWVLSDRN
mgnify:CR=1 FL=1